ncbi:MAG: hypothetical protein J3Q66DRAFT_409700 [Benniella sp.]|nr:MAG: hypothetical protein J3Q66DRAFT_409700 [Benniella sp.]
MVPKLGSFFLPLPRQQVCSSTDLPPLKIPPQNHLHSSYQDGHDSSKSVPHRNGLTLTSPRPHQRTPDEQHQSPPFILSPMSSSRSPNTTPHTPNPSSHYIQWGHERSDVHSPPPHLDHYMPGPPAAPRGYPSPLDTHILMDLLHITSTTSLLFTLLQLLLPQRVLHNQSLPQEPVFFLLQADQQHEESRQEVDQLANETAPLSRYVGSSFQRVWSQSSKIPSFPKWEAMILRSPKHAEQKQQPTLGTLGMDLESLGGPKKKVEAKKDPDQQRDCSCGGGGGDRGRDHPCASFTSVVEDAYNNDDQGESRPDALVQKRSSAAAGFGLGFGFGFGFGVGSGCGGDSGCGGGAGAGAGGDWSGGDVEGGARSLTISRGLYKKTIYQRRATEARITGQAAILDPTEDRGFRADQG